MPRRAPDLLALAALVGLAFWVRAGWMADWSRYGEARGLRRIFDGHERRYLEAFQGQGLADPSASFVPALGRLFSTMGHLSQDPRLLLVFAAMTGALSVGVVGLWTRRQFGAGAALWAALFVALLPEHAAWSTSVYPVMLAHLLGLGCLYSRRALPAAGLAVLAAWLRPELALVTLFRGAPGLAGLLGAGLALLTRGGPPAGSRVPLPWGLLPNLPMVDFLGPPILLLGLLGLGERRAWPLLGVAAWVHLTGCFFDDYGARHALMGGVALCVLAGLAAQRWGALLGLLVAGGLAVQTGALAEVWAQPADLSAEAVGLPAAPPAGCQELSLDPPSASLAPSHLALWAHPVPPGACFTWSEEGQHRAWSSRGLRDRARRMRRLYGAAPVAAARGPGGWRIDYAMAPPRLLEPR